MKLFLKQLEILLTIACLVMIGLLVHRLREEPTEVPAINPDHIAAATQSLSAQNLSSLAAEEADAVMRTGKTGSLEQKMRASGLIPSGTE